MQTLTPKLAIGLLVGAFALVGAAHAQEGGRVEGREWRGPLIYEIKGASLGAISVESNSVHRYDRGRFYGPSTIEISGSAHNNAHDLVGNANYSYGRMYFRVLVRYEDVNGNIVTAADTDQPDGKGVQHGPGVHEFRVKATIPGNVKMVEGRSSVMVEISHYAAWNTATRNTVAANLQYVKPSETPFQAPPSGTIDLTGEWSINANNHRGRMTINQQGSRFTGTILGDQLIEGTITGNTVTFTRRISAIQHYTGTLTVAADGTATVTGTFTQNRSGSYRWTATKTTPSPPTTPDPPPASTPTPGRFTVEAGKRNVPQGGSVTVPVSLNNVGALANMNVNIHYDPSVVGPARNAARGNIIPQALFEANVRDRGVIRLGFAQREDIRGTGTLAQIPFEAVGRAGQRTRLRVEVTMAADAAGERVAPTELIHGEIVIVNPDGRIPGDTTGRGTLTALDAMNALKMSVGNLPVDMVADMDQDGRVTSRDATLILQRVVGR